MKKTSLYIALIFIALTACNKSEKAYKQMDGTWTIVEYEYLNYSGLRYFYPAEGTYDFEEVDGQSGKYHVNMTYLVDSLSMHMDLYGDYSFIDKNGEYFTMTAIDTTGSTENITHARVILLTKIDMKLEFTSTNGKHVFILER